MYVFVNFIYIYIFLIFIRCVTVKGSYLAIIYSFHRFASELTLFTVLRRSIWASCNMRV